MKTESVKNKSRAGVAHLSSPGFHIAYNLCNASLSPTILTWGSPHNLFCNDAARLPFGVRRPPLMEEAIETAFGGEPVCLDSLQVFVDRGECLEERSYVFSFTPVLDESGDVDGVLSTGHETTIGTLRERRARALRDLMAAVAKAGTIEEIFILAAQAMAAYKYDLPFMLFYRLENQSDTATLVSRTGIPDGAASCPVLLTLGGRYPDIWPLEEVRHTGQAVLIPDPAKQLGSLHCGPYPERPRLALALPIKTPDHQELAAILVAGVSARLELNESYRKFYDLLAMILSNAVAAVGIAREQFPSREDELKAETVNFLESSSEAFITMDSEWRYVFVNAHAEKILQKTRGELLGHDMWSMFPEVRGTAFEREYRRAMEDRVSVRLEEFYKPLGIWIEVSAYPLRSGGLGFFFRDVSYRKRMEFIVEGQKQALELAVHGEPLESILDVLIKAFELQSGDDCKGSIMLLDPDGKRLRSGAAPSLSTSYCQAVDGLVIGPAVGCCGTAAFTGRMTIVSDIASNPLWESFRDVALACNLRACWSTPIFSTKGKVLGTFAIYYHEVTNPAPRDREIIEFMTRTVAIILEQKREMREREQAENALKEADRRKDEFLAILAHELRNPLAPIGNAIHIMRSPVASATMKDEARDLIERQTCQMARLVDDLMDVSRITLGKIELRKQIVCLSEVIGRAVETVRPIMEGLSHRLYITMPSEPLYIYADPARIAQVVSNVLNNAAKYTHAGGEICVTVARMEDKAVIKIRDNGIGIPQDKQDSIFDMFSQVENALDRAQGGLGIGLTLVKNFLSLHGGYTEVRSEGEGKGTEFNIYLPLNINNKVESENMLENSDKGSAAGARTFRILVVDDNEAVAKTIGWMLEMYGHDIYVAHDGLEAIELAKKHTPEIVLLDIGLPGMNGYEICQVMKTIPALQKTIFIAQTGWGQKEHLQRSQEAGFQHHLVKPVDAVKLQGILMEIAV